MRQLGESNSTRGSHSLPPDWEQAHDTISNRIFFIDHTSRTTTWLNPLDSLSKPRTVSECRGDELPYGWERINDPVIGVYYANHLERRNQWTNPVSDYRDRIISQHHYSNSQHIFSMEQSGNSLDSNEQTNSQTTCEDTKPNTLLNSSDFDDKLTTSLNNSNTLSEEIIDNMRSNNSTRNSKYDTSLIDIMDIRFGRESSQSVEV